MFEQQVREEMTAKEMSPIERTLDIVLDLQKIIDNLVDRICYLERRVDRLEQELTPAMDDLTELMKTFITRQTQ